MNAHHPTRARHCTLCSRAYGDHLPACPRSIQNRLWPQVQITDGCWIWTGLKDDYGYGKIYYLGYMQKASRVSWQLTYGAIPENTMVCHHCDNPLCVRPDHLFLGDHVSNAKDMAAKGRQVFQRRPEHATRGEQHYAAKLTEEDIRAIRMLRSQGAELQAIADVYQVSKQTIWRAVHRLTWKHVE